MPATIGIVSQKGGVGKSTVARLVATEFARNGWEVKIADMDSGQKTCSDWNARRIESAVEPNISVEVFPTVAKAIRFSEQFDLLIFDSLPMATSLTLEIAQCANLVLLPTGTSLDDLIPTVKLCHELVKQGVPKSKLNLILSKVGDSEADLLAAQDYIQRSGYELLGVAVPEKTSYRQAMDAGRSLAETKFKKLNETAISLISEIAQKIS